MFVHKLILSWQEKCSKISLISSAFRLYVGVLYPCRDLSRKSNKVFSYPIILQMCVPQWWHLYSIADIVRSLCVCTQADFILAGEISLFSSHFGLYVCRNFIPRHLSRKSITVFLPTKVHSCTLYHCKR